MLGPVEIYREFSRPLAADAWATRRARDILCFIASRRHRRASKDTIIDTFWGETEMSIIEKNFHPTISHIRKALNSNQPFKQNFILYRDGDYQLNPELSYRIDVEEFDQLVTRGENARRARQFDDVHELTNKLWSFTAANLRREATNRGSMNREVTTARNTFTCSNHWLESHKNRKNGPGHFNWPSRSCMKILSRRYSLRCYASARQPRESRRGPKINSRIYAVTRARTWNRTKS
jgi:hypothetical protein